MNKVLHHLAHWCLKTILLLAWDHLCLYLYSWDLHAGAVRRTCSPSQASHFSWGCRYLSPRDKPKSQDSADTGSSGQSGRVFTLSLTL